MLVAVLKMEKMSFERSVGSGDDSRVEKKLRKLVMEFCF